MKFEQNHKSWLRQDMRVQDVRYWVGMEAMQYESDGREKAVRIMQLLR